MGIGTAGTCIKHILTVDGYFPNSINLPNLTSGIREFIVIWLIFNHQQGIGSILNTNVNIGNILNHTQAFGNSTSIITHSQADPREITQTSEIRQIPSRTSA